MPSPCCDAIVPLNNGTLQRTTVCVHLWLPQGKFRELTFSRCCQGFPKRASTRARHRSYMLKTKAILMWFIGTSWRDLENIVLFVEFELIPRLLDLCFNDDCVLNLTVSTDKYWRLCQNTIPWDKYAYVGGTVCIIYQYTVMCNGVCGDRISSVIFYITDLIFLYVLMGKNYLIAVS